MSRSRAGPTRGPAPSALMRAASSIALRLSSMRLRRSTGEGGKHSAATEAGDLASVPDRTRGPPTPVSWVCVARFRPTAPVSRAGVDQFTERRVLRGRLIEAQATHPAVARRRARVAHEIPPRQRQRHALGGQVRSSSSPAGGQPHQFGGWITDPPPRRRACGSASGDR